MSSAKNEGKRWVLTWFGISAGVVILDLWTKKLVSDRFELYEQLNILPVFDITLRHNYGAAFSFLAGADGWQVWFLGGLAACVSIGIAIWILKIGRTKSVEVLALSLILGGAVGNLYDRVTLGYVVDFILVYYKQYQFPAFNVADSVITCGAILLIYDALFLQRHKKNDESDTLKKGAADER